MKPATVFLDKGRSSRSQQTAQSSDRYRLVVHRSPRRKITVEAKLIGRELHVYLPAGLSKKSENQWISKMKSRLDRRVAPDKEELLRSLERRARRLNERYFDGKLEWQRLKLTRSSKTMYGSCSPDTKEIRVSKEIQVFPRWVQDYILVHELAHLVEASHGKRFWDLVNRYEKAQLARGYLMGWAQRGIAEGRPA